MIDDGKAVLRELDIAEELPCRRHVEVSESTEEILTNSNDWDDDIQVHENLKTAPCLNKPVRRLKRNIWNDAGTWGTRDIPYTIVRSQFCKYSKHQFTNLSNS